MLANSASRRRLPIWSAVGVKVAEVAPEIAVHSDGAFAPRFPDPTTASPAEVQEYHCWEIVTVPAPTQTPAFDRYVTPKIGSPDMFGAESFSGAPTIRNVALTVAAAL